MTPHANGNPASAPPPRGPSAPPPEVAEFLTRLRGRTPQEMLGAVAGGSLTLPFVYATIGTLAVMAALTAGPYAVAKMAPAPVAEAPATPAPAPAANTPAPPTDPAAPPAAVVADTPKGTPTPPPAGKAPAATPDLLDKLGEGGTKTASPKVNPLEKKDDDLFKELDRK